jgi:hypothetical protein
MGASMPPTFESHPNRLDERILTRRGFAGGDSASIQHRDRAAKAILCARKGTGNDAG